MANPALNTRFCCPIHLGLMTEPCTTPCGHTFDKISLQQLMAQPHHAYGQMQGPWACPTCRAPIPLSWYPVVNYDLKGIIGDAVAAFQGTPPAAAGGGAVPVQAVEPQVPPTITAKFANGDKIHIQVSVPADAKPLPLNVIAVVDMSGSMGGRATEPKPVVAGQAAEESSLMSRMDLTGHSVKALAKTLKPCDSLSVIGFDNEAVTFLPPTAMDAAGQDLAVATVAQIKPRYGTSFWAGISAALKALEASAAVNPGANNVIIFQTDGESDPSYDPPQGLIKSLEAWKDRHADIKFTLHTVGYGYGDALQSDLLLSVAKKCGGDFYYVPDGSVLAQVAIHLCANLGAITHTDVSLRLDGYDRAFLPVGFLQAGQTRDFILDGQATAVARLFVKSTEIATVSVSADRGDSVNALAHDIFECGLSTGLTTGRLDVAGIKTALGSLATTPYIEALLTDLDHADKYKGQISKGFLPENFKKWGKHYLPGVLSGHRNKWPMNFKDECSTFYETPVTKAAIEKGVEIYEALGSIKATFTASGFSAYGGAATPMVTLSAHGRNCTCAQCTGGGGCFTGDTVVRLLRGSKRMDELRAGDILLDPSNYEKGNTIKCVVRYDVDKPQPIVRFGDAGLTEFHPILVDDESGQLTVNPDNAVWDHPGHHVRAKPEVLTAVYNLILESGHMIILLQDSHAVENRTTSEWVIACTLAHTFTGLIISHSYFGKPVAGMPHVLEDLMKAPTWDKGYIVCKNTREERDLMGEIVRLICDFA
jgi:Mg-chelatase subunit ChlD